MEWIIVYMKRDEKIIHDYVEMMRKCGPKMGMDVAQPKFVFLGDDRTESFLKGLRNTINSKTQIAVIVFPSARSDKYSAVKKLLCTEIGIASQVSFFLSNKILRILLKFCFVSLRFLFSHDSLVVP